MEGPRHRRQIGLFLLAVVLPTVLLLGLGVQMLRQQRELAGKRLADHESSLRRQLRDAMRLELEKLLHRIARNEQVTVPDLILVAPLRDGWLTLPWESEADPRESGAARRNSAWEGEISKGQRQELIAKTPERAQRHYRRALARASRPEESGLARLHLARSLIKLGRGEEARQEYAELLQGSPRTTDELGIPLWMYAAEPLAAGGGFSGEILERIESEVTTQRWPPPVQVYRVREILERLESVGLAETPGGQMTRLRSWVDRQTRDLETVVALQKALPELLGVHDGAASSPPSEQVWIAYGEQLWLASTVTDGVDRDLAVVVDGPELWRRVVAAEDLAETPFGAPQLLSSRRGTALPIGAGFPGLAVGFSGPRDSRLAAVNGIQQRLLLAALTVVVGVTLFGAYLLWRDVRREVRTAELRSQFVASVSHELKTPLTAIRMFAETLAMGRPEDPTRRNEYLDTIVNESERLSRLLDNVLDFSKIEQGTKQYRLASVDLAEVVRAAARAVRYPLAQQGFELEVEVADDLPAVRADADAVEQALLNLLGNAMKFSGQSRTIRLGLRRHNGRARIEVTDFGVGISEDEQARIFDKFYRAESAEVDRIPGAGLGLALVRHIAEAHGGNVRVRSSPGEGSTLAIELPLEEAS